MSNSEWRPPNPYRHTPTASDGYYIPPMTEAARERERMARVWDEATMALLKALREMGTHYTGQETYICDKCPSTPDSPFTLVVIPDDKKEE